MDVIRVRAAPAFTTKQILSWIGVAALSSLVVGLVLLIFASADGGFVQDNSDEFGDRLQLFEALHRLG